MAINKQPKWAERRNVPLILQGDYASYCVPDVLYHGTFHAAAECILVEGLKHEAGKQQSMASRGMNYLTTSLAMAASIARSRAHRHGGRPQVIAIDSSKLNPDHLSFDLNMCGMHWSESVAYGLSIPPNGLFISNMDAQFVPDEPMLLEEPIPGERPIVFNMDWARAQEFLAALQPLMSM